MLCFGYLLCFCFSFSHGYMCVCVCIGVWNIRESEDLRFGEELRSEGGEEDK